MTRIAASCLALIVASTAVASVPQTAQRPIEPSAVLMALPDALGDMERPAVEFAHAAHVAALEGQDCTTCHSRDDRGYLLPELAATRGIDDRGRFIDAVHDACIDCHEERAETGAKSGPTSCGGCHVKRPPGVSERAEMGFDYSLHARHVKAADDKCESCHHVWDEASQRLRYEKGAEEACAVCHGEVAVEDTPSLATAAHMACISCHLERAARATETEQAGPTRCDGCHSVAAQAAFVELEELPRLERGQPDAVWVHSADASYPAVAFDHLGHEPEAGFCSDCHHQSLQACDACHTLTGAAEGAGLTLALAHHDESSMHSCVGCHRAATGARACVGCHAVLPAAPSERACRTCHDGPRTAEAVAGRPPELTELSPAPLPATSDDYPDTVVIDFLESEYQATKLPHAKIVAALDAGARSSRLAARFHGDTGTLCAGCHHHSPAGVRPPACRTCHPETADPLTDRPGLKVAYHRQCVGCHVEMNVPKQGCTDCHQPKEAQQ